jgi:hypothetical protein
LNSAFEPGALLLSLAIVAASSALFVYWFRYTCLLILRGRASGDFIARLPGGKRLRYPEVQRRLEAATGGAELHPLRGLLEKDYRLLLRLLRAHEPSSPVETRILRVDFLLMGVWFGLVRRLSLKRAAAALGEMVCIVAYLAGEV